MNDLVEKKAFTEKSLRKYKKVELRFLHMDPEFARRLDKSSKLDRQPELIEALMGHGEERADAFLTDIG